jgi:hypothetical protein
MKIKCVQNTGEILMNYERRPLGTSEITEYGELEIGREYLVMGMILFNNYLSYLIDDNGLIAACPYQLFEVIDYKLYGNWYFRAFTNDDDVFPYQEAIWGYYELCFDDNHFEQLIEKKECAQRIYFKRKIEIEKQLSE